MVKKFKLGLVFLILISSAKLVAQHKKSYQLFDQSGTPISYEKMVDSLSQTDVVLFGEFHNNPIIHWLQLEITEELKSQQVNLTLGAEMFEADSQQVLNLYLNDSISEKEFKEKSRAWQNYNTDYKPLVDFAKTNEIDFIATNVPRPFASKVYKNGGFKALDSLTSEEKKWVAPLPIPFNIKLESYQNMLEMMNGHGGDDIVKAQALKDATMAHFILKNYSPNEVFVHFNGSYHSNIFEGIYWYLKQYSPKIKILTIAAAEQKEVEILNEENQNLGNFIIVVDENMTKTY
ncbi:ChaN family lipoprotein [Psychroflexus aestuariivivens]|uniref:ChaN family lipoprotein n=1 Tax=Psychroflexus aestuariivivens TaxID=1795040 RepID=UPI000FD928EF|nr:ChaN family lipoprotein [Psychroflexus aestuariivivens]